MMTRLIIYLLAMMTGFSAAEAARPVSETPASVGAKVGEAYASVVVKVGRQTRAVPVADAPISTPPSVQPVNFCWLSSTAPTTPVLRHDVILG